MIPLQGCPFTGRLEAAADASPADRITFLDRQMIVDIVQQVGTDNDIPTARYYIADSDSRCIESKLQRQPDHRAGFSFAARAGSHQFAMVAAIFGWKQGWRRCQDVMSSDPLSPIKIRRLQ
jgi:hypothetical protein